VTALVPSQNTTILAISVVAILALLALYASFIKLFEPHVDLSIESNHVEFLGVLRALLVRTMPMLLLAIFERIVLYPVAAFHISDILAFGFLKAVHWILLFRIVRTIAISQMASANYTRHSIPRGKLPLAS
jgi:hypothetical protein